MAATASLRALLPAVDALRLTLASRVSTFCTAAWMALRAVWGLQPKERAIW